MRGRLGSCADAAGRSAPIAAGQRTQPSPGPVPTSAKQGRGMKPSASASRDQTSTNWQRFVSTPTAVAHCVIDSGLLLRAWACDRSRRDALESNPRRHGCRRSDSLRRVEADEGRASATSAADSDAGSDRQGARWTASDAKAHDSKRDCAHDALNDSDARARGCARMRRLRLASATRTPRAVHS